MWHQKTISETDTSAGSDVTGNSGMLSLLNKKQMSEYSILKCSRIILDYSLLESMTVSYSWEITIRWRVSTVQNYTWRRKWVCDLEKLKCLRVDSLQTSKLLSHHSDVINAQTSLPVPHKQQQQNFSIETSYWFFNI